MQHREEVFHVVPVDLHNVPAKGAPLVRERLDGHDLIDPAVDLHAVAVHDGNEVAQIMVRQPNNKGNAGSATNGMPPTSSMGCGTWGGNIVSENIALKHYMNTTWVARPIPEDMPSLQELFGDFYKDGMDVE